jgi:hypothetical protein
MPANLKSWSNERLILDGMLNSGHGVWNRNSNHSQLNNDLGKPDDPRKLWNNRTLTRSG